MKLHVIDGTYELFRHYFAVPSSRSVDGNEVGATRGLLRSLALLLRGPDVSHVAVAFDHVIESFRNQLLASYKSSAGVETELLSQFPLAEEATRALGLVVWPMVEFEADDAMASAAAKWSKHKSVDQVVLCSRDKDLAQCVLGDRVVMWDRMNDVIIDERKVIERWGIPPKSIPDYLALVGDSADGIPGIPRWGAKSAAAILARYEHIESIPPFAVSWDVKVRGALVLADNLRERMPEARLYKSLCTLRTDVPLCESLKELRWRGAHRAQLQALCDRFGEKRLLEQIDKFAD
jgi:5'-3' exonuclease